MCLEIDPVLHKSNLNYALGHSEISSNRCHSGTKKGRGMRSRNRKTLVNRCARLTRRIWPRVWPALLLRDFLHARIGIRRSHILEITLGMSVHVQGGRQGSALQRCRVVYTGTRPAPHDTFQLRLSLLQHISNGPDPLSTVWRDRDTELKKLEDISRRGGGYDRDLRMVRVGFG